ncbi:MAG TPA: hypothetical protein PLJ47_08545 [Candidatus Hydrogenedentes bacterium]|nr:hypothetical protein [Candidatus Hydrogenedentota bacterium]
MKATVYVLAGFICCAMAVLFLPRNEANAALPRDAAMPIGKEVIVNMRVEASGIAGSSYAGTLIAFDDNWVVVRGANNRTHWCAMYSVATVSAESNQ